LSDGGYVPIAPADQRLPSKELGLQLEADGNQLRFYDPASDRWLPTPQEARLEALAALQQRDAALQQRDAALQQAEAKLQEKDSTLRQAEAELERLRRELAALRGGK
jgi:hypothetical protein